MADAHRPANSPPFSELIHPSLLWLLWAPCGLSTCALSALSCQSLWVGKEFTALPGNEPQNTPADQLLCFLFNCLCVVCCVLRGQLQEGILSFHLGVPGGQTQVIGLGSKGLYQGSRLTDPPLFLFGDFHHFSPFLLKFKHYIISSPVYITPCARNVNLINRCCWVVEIFQQSLN